MLSTLVETTTAIGLPPTQDNFPLTPENKASPAEQGTRAEPRAETRATAKNATSSGPLIELDNGNSKIWLALAVIMVVTIVLLISVIVVVCWAKRGSVMVVR